MRYDDTRGESPGDSSGKMLSDISGASPGAGPAAGAPDDLLAALALDLPGHFPQVVTRYQRAIATFARRLTGASHDAEDLAQEAFISAYVSLENYPPDRIRSLKLRPWLYRVTLNVWRHSLRGARLRLVPLGAPADDEYPGDYDLSLADDPQERPDALFEQGERRQELEALVARLPERYRVAIACYYLEDLSYQEVADLLDQPVGTVKSTIHRGVRQLRGLIGDNAISSYEDYHIAAGAPCEGVNPLRAPTRRASPTPTLRESREA